MTTMLLAADVAVKAPALLAVGPDLGRLAAIAVLCGEACHVLATTDAQLGLHHLERALAAGDPPALAFVELRDAVPDRGFMRALARSYPECPVVLLGKSASEVGDALTDAPRICAPLALTEAFAAVYHAMSRLARLPDLSDATLAAIDHVTRHFRDKLTLESLAMTAGVSPSHLAHLFRAQTNTSVWTFVLKIRIEVAKHLLRDTALKLEAIAEQTGFSDASHLSREFLGRARVRPGGYRRQQVRRDCAGRRSARRGP